MYLHSPHNYDSKQAGGQVRDILKFSSIKHGMNN
jgi:hypothetical protein